MASKAPTPKRDRLFTRRQIEDEIARGRHLIIVENKVIKCDAWLPFHPGGDKAIKHMLGRDATDEVNALHSPEARRQMNSFIVGRVEGAWQNFVPPIQGGTFRTLGEAKTTVTDQDASESDESEQPSPIFETLDQSGVPRKRGKHISGSSSATSLSSLDLDSPKNDANLTQEERERDLAKYPSLEPEVQRDIAQKYRELNLRIKAQGLYDCNYTAYAIECARYTALFTTSMILLHHGWYAASAVFLGMFWHQLTFTAHDAGHMGITHHFHIDTCIGILVANYLGGISLGWWKRNHNVHHIVTNSPEHDPDIEHMPFFAISHRFFGSLRSTYYDRVMTYDPVARFMIKYQSYLYYPILTFGRFNLYRLSLEYLLLGQGPRKGPAWWHRWFEIAGIVFFWAWFGSLVASIPSWHSRLLFVAISHAVTMPLHVQITLSHFAMSTADLGVHESFAQKMLRTTMDVDCPQWLDFFHGGLQFQAVHHLYPRIPRHNLRAAQRLVQQFCNETGIPYALYGFVDGNKQVIGHLGEIGRQARILAACQQATAAHALQGLDH